jgi:hypothetical protein
MWLESTLGSVTCADAATDAVNDTVAAGTKTSRRTDRRFKTTLAQFRMSANIQAHGAADFAGKRTLSEAAVSRHSPLSALTASSLAGQNPRSAGIQASAAAAVNPAEFQGDETAYSGRKEMKTTHE